MYLVFNLIFFIYFFYLLNFDAVPYSLVLFVLKNFDAIKIVFYSRAFCMSQIEFWMLLACVLS